MTKILSAICHGSVDGVLTFWRGVYLNTILQANAVAGVAGVQAVLAPILLATLPGATPPFPQGPVYSSSNLRTLPLADAKNTDVSVPEALAAGTWTA